MKAAHLRTRALGGPTTTPSPARSPPSPSSATASPPSNRPSPARPAPERRPGPSGIGTSSEEL
ncbi:hypothetical protein ACR6C2_35295 [Streptomyces sp. INA 01156]